MNRRHLHGSAVEGGWRPGPDIDIVVGCDSGTSDPFQVNSAVLDGDALQLSVSYSGGCAEHLFRMCWDGSFMESWPVQVAFALQHEGNDVPCDAYPTEELTVSLDALREAYRDSYGSAEGIVKTHFADELFEYMFEAP